MEAREYELMYELELTHWWFVGKRLAAAALLRSLEPIAGLRVDVGAGTGAMLSEHLGRGPALGVELDPQAAQLCARRVGPVLVRGRSNALPLTDGAAGLVTVMDMLYHQGVDVAATLAECRRVLRPGGYLLIFDAAYQGLLGPHDRSMHAARRFTRAGLTLRVERAGFQVLRAGYRNALLAPGLIALRLVAKWLERLRGPRPEPPASDVARPPDVLNRLLLSLMAREARWLRNHDLPLGTSVCLLCQKPR
ncbi:MAG: class I SAM-dependent methyltransferase [Pseudomonadota bacterium]